MRQPEWSSDGLLSKRTHHVPFRLLDTAAVALLTRRPRRLPMITMTPKARLVATLTVAGPWFAVALLILGAARCCGHRRFRTSLRSWMSFKSKRLQTRRFRPTERKLFTCEGLLTEQRTNATRISGSSIATAPTTER